MKELFLIVKYMMISGPVYLALRTTWLKIAIFTFAPPCDVFDN